jgi:hypothetical protein
MSLRSSNSVRDHIAMGNTSQRPSGQNGLIRHNTSYGDGGRPEFYVNGSWIRLDEAPAPGNGQLGISAKPGGGCSVSGSPGRANQTTASTQTLSLNRSLIEDWYKDPDPAYKSPAGGSGFFDARNLSTVLLSNYCSSVTRAWYSDPGWQNGKGMFDINYSSNKRYVVNGQTNTSTFRPEFEMSGEHTTDNGGVRNKIPLGLRDWDIYYVDPSYNSFMSFIY